jgi:hypothetical protein
MGTKPLVGMVGMVCAGLTLSGCMHSSSEKGTFKASPTMSQTGWGNTPKNNTGAAIAGGSGTPAPNNGGAAMTPLSDVGRPPVEQTFPVRNMSGITPPSTATPLPGAGAAGQGMSGQGMPGAADVSGAGQNVTPGSIQRVSAPAADMPTPPPVNNPTTRSSFGQNNSRPPSTLMETREFTSQGEATRTPTSCEDCQKIHSVSGSAAPLPPPPPPPPYTPSKAMPTGTETVPPMPAGTTTDTLPAQPVPVPGTK